MQAVRPLLAIDKVRYAGERVAAVVALDEDIAEEALGLIEVEYEPLPALVTLDEAITPGAPAIHETVAQRDFLTCPDLVINVTGAKNILNYYRLRKGDIEAGFAEADEIFEETFRMLHQQHCPLESHITIARIDGDKVTLCSTAASPYTARFQVAETLRVPLSSS